MGLSYAFSFAQRSEHLMVERAHLHVRPRPPVQVQTVMLGNSGTSPVTDEVEITVSKATPSEASLTDIPIGPAQVLFYNGVATSRTAEVAIFKVEGDGF